MTPGDVSDPLWPSLLHVSSQALYSDEASTCCIGWSKIHKRTFRDTTLTYLLNAASKLHLRVFAKNQIQMETEAKTAARLF